MRYDQIVPILDARKPKVSIEVGVHKGHRARIIASRSQMYYGFDLWEMGDEELDRKEYNGKGRSLMKTASDALQGTKHELIQGNTLVTLPEFVKRGVKVDFCFLDGGHSVETIASDWKHVKQMMAPGGIVVLDDFYTPENRKFGCNKALKDEKFTVLPDMDKTQDGWECRLAVVKF